MREDIRPAGSDIGGGDDAGGRVGGGVVIVIVYGGGRLLQTDGDERQGQPTKIHGRAVVGLDAAGACVQPPSRPGCNVSEKGRRPAGQKSCEGRRDGGGWGGTTTTAARQSETTRKNPSMAKANTKSVGYGESRGGNAQLGGLSRRRSVQPMPKTDNPRHLTPTLYS
jgi:hypothetical protein